MIFFVALLPAVIHLQTLHFVDYMLIFLAVAFILPLVLGAYSFAASRARRFFRKASSIRLLNRGAGAAMAGAAVVAVSQ
jgi:threonine/homoserine/homoserine lactone efflux protein